MSEGNVTRSEVMPLLNGLEPKPSGDWVHFHCPVPSHGQGRGDRDRSAAISKAGVLKCFASCDFKDLIAALRLRGGEVVAREPRSENWPKEPARTYEYRALDGTLLAVKSRFERPNPEGGKPDKTFRWRLPDGDYAQGLGQKYTMKEMPLWGIDGLARDPEYIWFTEGEEAARALQVRGEVAVSGGWGASQRDFGDSLLPLTGRKVILWPDNDPPGREYMQEIRKALRGIAQSVAVVSPPVPPKGDAVEYFQMGLKVEDLLTNALATVAVEILSGNHLAVRIPSEEGTVRFDFDRITRSTGTMECELVVSHANPAFEAEPYAIRMNILSASARSQLETALGKQFGKTLNWTTFVSMAFSRARTAHNEMDRTQRVGTLPEMEAPQFLIDQLLPENSDTIIFGDGSSCKTYVAYGMALDVALGGKFCGFPVKQGAVLILDYETGQAMAKLRLKRLLRGAGFDPIILDDLPIHYIDAEGVPLAELRESLKAAIGRHDVRFLIIDAAGDACGGEPEKAGVVLSYFNACAELKVTRLHIAHVTNSEMEVSAKRPFGSRYWHNRARRTWFVKRDQEEESDTVDVGFICRKVNDGRLPKPKAFQINFVEDSGPVTISTQAFREVVAFEKDQSTVDRVTSFLARTDGPATIFEIADAEMLDRDAVKTALYRGLKKHIFTIVSGGTGRGVQNRWGLAADG